MLITFKAIHGEAPQYIQELLVPYKPTRVLRSESQLLLVEKRTKLKTYGDRAFSHIAPQIWNSLPLSLKNSHNKFVFKKNLKTFLFRNRINSKYSA